MKQIQWELKKGAFTITASDGRKRTLDTQQQIDFMLRLNELEKFWDAKIVALEAAFFPLWDCGACGKANGVSRDTCLHCGCVRSGNV